jgi:hypothetical protein
MNNGGRRIMGYRIALAALLLCVLRVGAAPAADVQVNSLDNNAPTLDNYTTESETNVAVSGALVVVGYNTTRQLALGSGAFNSICGFAYSSDGGANFTDGGFVPAGAQSPRARTNERLPPESRCFTSIAASPNE